MKLKEAYYFAEKTKHEVIISISEEDARAAYHGGVCDEDVKALCTKDYIKEQLKNISKEDIQNILDNYGCDYDEDSIADMQECLIWLAAGDIVEDK